MGLELLPYFQDEEKPNEPKTFWSGGSIIAIAPYIGANIGLSRRFDIGVSVSESPGLKLKYQAIGEPGIKQTSEQWVGAIIFEASYQNEDSDFDREPSRDLDTETDPILPQRLFSLEDAETDLFSGRLAYSGGYKFNQWLLHGSIGYELKNLETKFKYEEQPKEELTDILHFVRAQASINYTVKNGFYVDIGAGVNYMQTKRIALDDFEPSAGIKIGWAFISKKNSLAN